MAEVFERDWNNIQAGLYAAPAAAENPVRLIRLARDFLKDAPRVAARRRSQGHSEVLTPGRAAKYPRYYLQNFHFQTGGWLSDDSARLYDFQVETLFAGTAEAMRRLGLAPVARYLAGRDQRRVRLLDVACGTGGVLRMAKQNWPRLSVTGLDLSAPYLERAAMALRDWRGVTLLEANAEAMPLPDASQDIVVCIYLFHELPPKIRPRVAAEIARVLRPGGLFVLTDSIQPRDAERFTALMEVFPQLFHEPYYRSYLDWRAEEEFGAHGLVLEEAHRAFLSAIKVFSKPR
jgi:ubiquinone/menaquinone biosynthesis C-methylase UbiE